MNFVSAYMFFKKTNPPVARSKTIVHMERRDDFLADIQELGLEADKHACYRSLPRGLINKAPAPVLQPLRSSKHYRILYTVTTQSGSGDVIFQHIEMAIVRILFVS